MKKIFAFIVALALSVISSNIAFAETKYVNDTFDMSLTGWAVHKDADEILEWDHESKGFLKWNGFVHMKTDNSCYMQKNVTGLTAGDLMTISFDLKTISLTSEGSAGITLDFFDDTSYKGSHKVGYKDVSDDFTNYEFDFIVPEKATRVHILVRLSAGEVYFDNIILTDRYNQSDLKLTNGSLVMPHLVDGLNKITAKLHYVPTSSNENLNLILAEYSKNDDGNKELNNVEILPIHAEGTLFEELTLNITKNTDEVSAFVWRNDNTLVPLMEKASLLRDFDDSVYDLFASKKMRAVTMGLSVFYDNQKLVQDIIDSGCNTFIINLLGTYHGGNVNKDKDALDKVCDDLEEFVEKTKTHVFLKGNFGDNQVISNVTYGAYSPGKQNSLTLPCPLSNQYWEEQMLTRFSTVANHPKIDGVVFDMEMYSGGSTKYSCPCFCSTCTEKFAEENPGNKSTTLLNADVETRQQYAINNGIYGEYNEWFSQKVTKLTSEMREKLHKINPDLILGYMPEIEWLTGITEGLGTDNRPVVIFNEKEYKGDLGHTYMNISKIRLNELPAVYCVGLWTDETSAIKIENISEKIYDSGKQDIGYFIYGIPYIEEENLEGYLTEIKSGNTLLDTCFD